MFKDQLGKSMEENVDDMMIKINTTYGDIEDLREVFWVIKKFKMRHNLKNCVFCITLGKFLGYLILACKIEANLDKTQVLVDMKLPNNLKGIQQLIGNIVLLNRFISKGTNKCFTFFKLLRKNILVF